MASVVLTAALPTVRKDGSPLAPIEIASTTFLRDVGGGLGPIFTASGPFSEGTVAYVDPSPPLGSVVYAFYVTDTKGLQGDTSIPINVTVAAPVSPPAAGTLTAEVQP